MDGVTSAPSSGSRAALTMPAQPRSVGVAHIASGVAVGFKALPTASLPASYTPRDAASLSNAPEPDWAGIYPQLSFAQAVAYLPNQFERGYKSAHIVKLTARKPLVVVTCSDAQFMDGSMPSSAKAQLVRAAIHSLATSPVTAVPPLRGDLPLMRACGESEIVLCVPDAEGYELVVPKALFTQEWLACESLFTLHESARVPAMVGRVEEQPELHRSVLLDWEQLTRTLEAQVAEPRCTELARAVAASLSL